MSRHGTGAAGMPVRPADRSRDGAAGPAIGSARMASTMPSHPAPPPSVSSGGRAGVACPVKEEIRRNAVAKIAAGRAAVRRRARLRGHRPAAARERAPRRPRRDLPRRAGPGQDPHDPLAHRPARRVDADHRRLARSTTTRTHPVSRARPRPRRRARRRHADRVGAPRRRASARSWPRPTRRSPTSSARSTRSRSPRAATSPTS